MIIVMPITSWICLSGVSSLGCTGPRRHSREVMRQLGYRDRLVKIRTMIKNNLQSIALGSGVSLPSELSSAKGRERLEALALPAEGRRARGGRSYGKRRVVAGREIKTAHQGSGRT